MSVIPLSPAGSGRPQIADGRSGIVNATDGSPTYKPGAFLLVNGTNLASTAIAEQIPAPTLLGGSCVTFSDVPIPLLQTSPSQIMAQLPDTLQPGTYVVQVRSLALAQQSDPIVVTVQRP